MSLQSLQAPVVRTAKRQQPRMMEPGIDRDDRPTPDWLFEALNKEFGFTLDAAASADNARCANYYDAPANGLIRPWEGVVWCNPPYVKNSRIGWLRPTRRRREGQPS